MCYYQGRTGRREGRVRLCQDKERGDGREGQSAGENAASSVFRTEGDAELSRSLSDLCGGEGASMCVGQGTTSTRARDGRSENMINEDGWLLSKYVNKTPK